jgi:iron complex outermembrane receptor protein
MISRSSLLLSGAALVALGFVASPGAFAQEAQGASDQTRDIVTVTARRREESLQDAPVAVSAFSAADLQTQQVDDLLDLNAVVPTLLVAEITGAGVAQIYLRGAGQDDSQAASEQPIGIYLDGVPYTKAPGAVFDVIEFERIEVLRGPQGTLYGRNATGGAIKYETRRPSLTDSRVVADVTFGTANRLDARASYSAPLSETFAAKVDIISRSRDGFLEDAFASNQANDRPAQYNAVDRQSVRLAGLWEPAGPLTLYMTADLTTDDSGPQSGTPAITSAPGSNLNASGQISQARPLYGPRLAAPTLARPQTFDGYGFMANATYETDAVIYTAIAGYRGFDLAQGIDTDSGPSGFGVVDQNGNTVTRGFGFDFIRDWSNRSATLELQAASNTDGALTWVAGVFAMNESNESDDVFGRFSDNEPFRFGNQFLFDQTTTSLAIYAEGTYAFTDRVELTLGGRYSYDEKELDRQLLTFSTVASLGAPYDLSTSDSWSQFTPRAILDVDLTDDVSVFASYARGFQAGAYQSFPFSATTANEAFDPTIVDNYEAGLRSQWLDGRFTANLTYFHAEYTDLPSTVTANQGVLEVLTNDVTLSGLEVELSARPTDALSLYAVAGFTNDEFDRSVVGASLVPGATENRLKYVADMTARVGGSYVFDLANGADLTVTANLTHNGDFFMSTVNTPFAFQEAYTTLGAEVTYALPDDRWAVSLGGRNLTDELYQQRASAGGGGVIFFAPPRTWYATIRYEMGG